jgi:hypothetical protein
MTMKGSVLDTAWLAATIAQCPPTLLPDGNLRGGPMRLSFPALDTPVVPSSDRPDVKKFMAMLLLPPNSDMSLYHAEAYKAGQKKFPNLDQPGGPTTAQLEWPFNDQAKKTHLDPFVAGSIFFSTNANEDRRPLCVDLRGAPIPNVKEKFYAGCWVLPILNPYGWAHTNAQGQVIKRGVSFGLAGLIWLADDTALSGGSIDVQGAIGGLGALAPPPGSLSGFGGVDASAMFTTTAGAPAAPVASAFPSGEPRAAGMPAALAAPYAPPAPAVFPPAAPAAAPVAPPPPPPAGKALLPHVQGTYDAHIAAGWTDAMLVQHGMMAA